MNLIEYYRQYKEAGERQDGIVIPETLVIREYCQQHKKQNLKDYILISSGEPCVMCSGAIKWAKIQQIYFSAPQKIINKLSGGIRKPSCKRLINSG